MIIRAHKIKLRPTLKQQELFRKAVGTARFAYNWSLARWQELYAAKEKTSECSLRRALNKVKRSAFPWMMEVPKSVVQQAVKNMGAAYSRFFTSLKKGPKSGHPRFKKKGGNQSARLDNGPDTFTFDGLSVKLPKFGKVRTFERLRFAGQPISATLRREGERWFLSVAVKTDEPAKNQGGAVGLDLGISSAATLSNGEKLEAPKPLKAALEKLARLGRSVSRKKKGSQNREKARRKLGRTHWRVAQVRQNWLHQATTGLARRFGTVFLEDLNVAGMVKNRCLSRAISDIGMGEFARQLAYKTNVVKVGRFFPSSKKCSECGTVLESLPLNIRDWTCACGASHDRDINAARNILNEGSRLVATASCAGSKACGESASAKRVYTLGKVGSSKQESGLIRKYKF